LLQNVRVKIVVSGGSGFIGTPLVKRLTARGDEVVVLSRNASRGLEWHPPRQGPWSKVAGEADVVINLAGENVGDARWSEARKRKLISSRLDATQALVEAMQNNLSQRRTFISASAVGYYGFIGEGEVDESSPRGAGFLAEVTEKWEIAAREATPFARVIILRIGVVLGPGGAVGKMLLPFRLGVGGPIGSGKQWMSWVDREDVLRAIEWAIDRDEARGVYNVTSPNPVRNRDFAHALGRALHRPALLPTPAIPVRLLFGQMADEALLGGQRAVPSRMTREGFAFEYATIDQSLAHAVEAMRS